jgi:hypothetical protein
MRSYGLLTWLFLAVMACSGGGGDAGASGASSGGAGGGRSGSGGGGSGGGGAGGQGGTPLGGGGGDSIPMEQDCFGENNCVGTRSCTGAGNESCTACVCNGNVFAPAWTVAGPDFAWDMAGAPDGSVYFLLGREPWVEHYAGADGAMIPFSARSTLDWASQITIGGDGSVYVAGDGMFGGDTTTVQVQQLDPSGELIATARWPGSEEATFAGLLTASDGSVLVAARQIDGQDLFAGVALKIAHVEGEQITEIAGPFGLSDFTFTEDDASPSNYETVLCAAGGPGDFVIGGGSSDFDTWLGFIADGSAAGAILVADSFAEPSLSEVSWDRAGGWYWGYGTGWTNTLSGIGTFSHHVFRANADGTAQWSKYYTKERRDRALSDAVMRATSIVGLDDSVVVVLGTLQGLESLEPTATLSRFGRDGALLSTLSFQGAVRAVRTGERNVALWSETELALVTFDPVQIELLADGAECTNAEVCEGGLCCLGVAGGPGVCASAGCAVGSKCSEAIACVQSDCLVVATETEGYCAPACAASTECPAQQFCVEGHCQASCSETEQCAPYAGTQCLDAMNAENQLVTICTEPIPDAG